MTFKKMLVLLFLLFVVVSVVGKILLDFFLTLNFMTQVVVVIVTLAVIFFVWAGSFRPAYIIK